MLAPNPLTSIAPKWHDVTIVCKREHKRACVEGVPPEEFGISRNARSIKDAGYVFHEVVRTKAQLVDQGYDEDQIASLPTFTALTNSEEQARNTVEDDRVSSDMLNDANRTIKITEHYIRMDYRGDGKPCLYRVTTGGEQGEILRREDEDDVVEVEEIPFAAMTPIIVTHRFFGRSIADLIMDIQRIKTALVRGLLDNMYLAMSPRTEVPESHCTPDTLDDLLVSRPGGIIRTKAPGGLTPIVHTDISAAIYPAIQYMDATREWRTGVSRQGQGVDPNALQNQVATIANQMFNASQAKVKLIARIFAETGIKDMFALLHATIRRHGSQAQTVRLRNKWVSVDPRAWRMRDDMTINVGLGTGSKAEQLAHLQLIIAAQEKAVAIGIVSAKNFYASAKELTRLAGHKDGDKFFTPPGAPPDPQDPTSAPIQPPPDPKMAELQAKAEIEKIQAQADIETTRDKTKMDAAMKEREFQFNSALEERRFELERELKLIDAQIKREQHDQTMQLKVYEADSKAEERKAKAEQGPKQSVEIKNDSSEIAKMMAQIGEHLQGNQAEHTKAIMDALSRPKRVVRDKNGRVSHVEMMN